MKLVVVRELFTKQSTIGKLYIDGVFECYTLEDVVRVDDPTTPENEGKKVWGQTAIPAGTYELTITMSQRFGKLLPLLNNVPNFTGIRIHPGNVPADTHGCLLVGQTLGGPDKILQSKAAFEKLFPKLLDATVKDKVFIEIR